MDRLNIVENGFGGLGTAEMDISMIIGPEVNNNGSSQIVLGLVLYLPG